MLKELLIHLTTEDHQKRQTELSKLFRNRSEDRMPTADESHRHLPDQDKTEETVGYSTLLYAANASQKGLSLL